MSNVNHGTAPKMHTKKIRLDMSDRVIRGFTYVVVTIFSLCCITFTRRKSKSWNNWNS